MFDTVEPVAYLDGQITLSLDDQIALLGGVLEQTAIGPYVPDSLPIRERTQFDVTGKFSKDLAESYITLTGAYVMDGGLLPARLGIEAKPVQAKGSLTISRDGVLADGVVASSIEPERILDGGAAFQAFIPFDKAGEAFASVKGKVAVPVAKLSADAGAKIGQAGYELRGRLATPFTPRELIGKTTGKINWPDIATAVKPTWEGDRSAGGRRPTGCRPGSGHGRCRQAAARFRQPGRGDRCPGAQINHFLNLKLTPVEAPGAG